MATVSEWVSAARPRTLPASIAPVLVGLGAAFGARHFWDENHPFSPVEIAAAGQFANFHLSRALLAMGVALALQVGVNYANDYSDGIRGTDLNRTGPTRLTASGAAAPALVKRAAFLAFGVAAVLGLWLIWLSGTWGLLIIGALAVLAAWFYSGGKRPYGYAGLGEVGVFIFFGLVATLGTTYTQLGRITLTSLFGAFGVGLLACAILMINNIRDIETDRVAGKRTLAARLGNAKARRWYVGFIVLAFVCAFGAAVWLTPWAWLTLLLVVPAVLLTAPVRMGARGKLLIPVLAGTAYLELAYAILLAIAFAITRTPR